ncbi:hypothetical protein [Nocardioides sp.]
MAHSTSLRVADTSLYIKIFRFGFFAFSAGIRAYSHGCSTR